MGLGVGCVVKVMPQEQDSEVDPVGEKSIEAMGLFASSSTYTFVLTRP